MESSRFLRNLVDFSRRKVGESHAEFRKQFHKRICLCLLQKGIQHIQDLSADKNKIPCGEEQSAEEKSGLFHLFLRSLHIAEGRLFNQSAIFPAAAVKNAVDTAV